MQLLGLTDLLFSLRRKQQQGDFSGCTTPTGGLDARDPFDLHQLGKKDPNDVLLIFGLLCSRTLASRCAILILLR